MGKKESKRGHRKKSSHKHKKEKKKKCKERKKYKSRKNIASSESESSTASSDYKLEWTEKKLEDINVQRKLGNLNDESEWNHLFSDKNMFKKEKIADQKDQSVLDKPGRSSRELNPYWKDGGMGLPPTNERSNQVDLNSLRRILEAATATSGETGEPVETIVRREWGSYEKLIQLLRVADNVCDYEHSSQKKTVNADNAGRSLQFKKPGEITDLEFTNTFRRNWRKRGINSIDASDVNQHGKVEEAKQKENSENRTVLTIDELNALTAKAIKAEIMGNKILSEQLKKEIEMAKKNRAEFSAPRESKTEIKSEQTVILTKTNSKGMTKPLKYSDLGMKHTCKVENNRGLERTGALIDDGKHLLRTMFENEKFGSTNESEEMFLTLAERAKFHFGNEDDIDDLLDRPRSSGVGKRAAEKEKNRNIREARQRHVSSNNCIWCLDGNSQKHNIISIGTKCYLCLPRAESLTDGHCLIVPIHHVTCGTLADEDVWDEMQIYRKRLCQMYEDSGQDVVFFENARSFHRFPHMILNCVPIDKEPGDLAPMYFKKAILDSETEWSNNKKLVDLKNKDLRRSIPKGLSYFAVDFGREGGFAHVIEDEKLFPPNFAEEVIGGMLDLNVQKWRKRRKESYNVQQEKVSEFLKRWKKYEFIMPAERFESLGDSSDSNQRS